jgi:hypothetical protein
MKGLDPCLELIFKNSLTVICKESYWKIQVFFFFFFYQSITLGHPLSTLRVAWPPPSGRMGLGVVSATPLGTKGWLD